MAVQKWFDVADDGTWSRAVRTPAGTLVHKQREAAPGGVAFTCGLIAPWLAPYASRMLVPYERAAGRRCRACYPAADALTLAATLAEPGSLCSGHRDEIPAVTVTEGVPYIPAYADGDGWLWCLACAKHMAACDDADCGHPRAVFADAVPA